MSERRPSLDEPCPHPSRQPHGHHEVYSDPRYPDTTLHCRACGARADSQARGRGSCKAGKISPSVEQDSPAPEPSQVPSVAEEMPIDFVLRRIQENVSKRQFWNAICWCKDLLGALLRAHGREMRR